MKTIVYDHFVQRGDLLRAILHVRIHCNHHPALCGAKACLKCCRFSEIPVKPNALEVTV
jgi:hypothetical protein